MKMLALITALKASADSLCELCKEHSDVRRAEKCSKILVNFTSSGRNVLGTPYSLWQYGANSKRYVHSQSQSQSHISTDSQSASLSWCQASIGDP
jgi:hypothetical protein